MPDFMLDGAINLHEFGVFLPPGRDQSGDQMREALFIIREENLAPLMATFEREAVVGIETIEPSEPLALCGFVLMTAKLRIHRDGFTILCLTVSEAGSTVFAVLAHASRRAMQWPIVEARPKLIVPGVDS